MCLISVIVPVYNVENYLVRCLDSIINQTYKNIEIILVDDGSPDNSGNICNQYAKLDNRIKVIHKKNGGLSDARNHGIDKAKGEYITFIDSDDWINCEYIEKLYNLINSTNSEIASCSFYVTDNNNNIKNNSDNDFFTLSNIEALQYLSGKYYLQLVIACCKLYKKSLFDEIRFPINKIHEDEFITYKLLYKSQKIVITNEKLYYYFQRRDSITKSFDIKKKFDAIEAIKERADFLKDIGLEKESEVLYKVLFLVFVSIRKHVKDLKQNEKEKIDNFYHKVQEELKNNHLSIMFNIFRYLYNRIPDLMSTVYNSYVFLRKEKE